MNKKVLIIHNILWSHYKAKVFNEFFKIAKANNIDILVLQIALIEKGREKLGEIDFSLHNYPYKLLFDKSYEETRFIKRAKAIIKELLSYKPDVVVIPGWSDLSYLLPLIYLKLFRKKIILQCDSTEYDKPRIWLKEIFKRFVVSLASASWCYGTASKNYLLKLGMKEGKIFIRCQATLNEEIEKLWRCFAIQKESLKRKYGFKKRNFIYVGRISTEKNVATLIKAFSKVKNDEWGLIIIGDGPLRQELQELSSKMQLNSSIYFLGGKSWQDVVEYYALADVFVLPSLSEPWGLVVNEAMICGLPVIVSNKAGSYYDLVRNGENGFGFSPDNQKELEDIMLKIVMGKADIKKMGEKSKEIIMNYTPENAAKSMYRGTLLCLEA